MEKFGCPEAVVGAFVLNNDGDLLLVRSKKWPELYSVPGGHIEMGESIGKAVKRETKEETGLDVKLVKVINLQEAIYPKAFHRKAHFIFIDALCRTRSAKVKLDNMELYDYMWVKPKASLKLKLNTYTRRSILQLVNRRIMDKWFYANAK